VQKEINEKKPTDLMKLTTVVNFTNQFPQSANAPGTVRMQHHKMGHSVSPTTLCAFANI
jgi:hypothetical protein